MDKGFKIVSLQEFRDMKISTMDPRPTVVFVNRKKAFKPPSDLLHSTVAPNWGLYEYLRRFKDERNAMELALKGCKYETRYRYRIVNDGDSLKLLRKLASESKKRPVILVKGKDNRPDADILVSMAKKFINDEVWK